MTDAICIKKDRVMLCRRWSDAEGGQEYVQKTRFLVKAVPVESVNVIIGIIE